MDKFEETIKSSFKILETIGTHHTDEVVDLCKDLYENLNQAIELGDITKNVSEHGNTLLHLLAKQYSKLILNRGILGSLIGSFLKNKDALNAQNKNGQTALHISIKNKNFTLASQLILGGINIKIQDKKGYSPLHLACRNSNLDLVNEILLHKEVDIEQKDFKGKTAIHYAAGSGKVKILEALFNKGSNIFAEDLQGQNALHFIANWEIADFLISKGMNKNSLSKSGANMLISGCKNSNFDLVQKILEYGFFDVNFKDLNGQTALHHAVFVGDYEIVTSLLENGANPALADNDGTIPLHLACKDGNLEIADKIIDSVKNANAYIDIQDKYGRGSLHYAIMSNSIEIVTLLLNEIADISECDYEGNTAVHYACIYQTEEILEKLLEAGVNVNIVNSFGDCPMHISVRNKNIEITSRLLKSSGDKFILNNDGESPFSIAKNMEYNKILNLMNQYG